MKKALVLTLTASEELPTPLTARLQHPGQSQSLPITFNKAEEVPGDLPIRLEFLYAGETIGFTSFIGTTVEQEETKWLSVGFADSGVGWDELEDETTGPRVQVTVESIRPLSPIMEMTEASECSLLDPSSGRISPTDDFKSTLTDLIKEKDFLTSRQKDLQMKIIDLQQTLTKERWKAKVDLEQSEQRHKAEIGHLVILIEKMKSGQKREAALIEELRGKLSLCEGKVKGKEEELEEIRGKWREKEEEMETATEMMETLQSENEGLETEIAALRRENEQLQEENKEQLAKIQAIQEDFGNRRLQTPDTRKSTPSTEKKPNRVSIESDIQQILDLKQSLASLQAALTASHEETDRKEKELRQVYAELDALKSRRPNTTLQELPGVESTMRDMVDDLLRDYAQSHQLTVPLVKISEGVYAVGSKKVNVTVRNGVPVIRVGGGFMFLEEFMKMYGPVEKFITPRRLCSLSRGGRKGSQDGRPRSIDTQRHHRSVTTGGETTWTQEPPSSQRVDTENSCDYGNATERGLQKLRGRDMSPRPVYWRETISSHNKTISKGSKARNEAVRFQILRG